MSLKGKSYKMGLQELKEMIRSEVASAIKSMDGEAPTQDSTVGDLEDVIAQALELVEEKRKSRKEAGEEVGELTGEEIMEAVGEILDAAKSSDDPEEGKACDDPEEGKEGEDPEEGKEGDDPEEQPTIRTQRHFMQARNMTITIWPVSLRRWRQPTRQRAVI